MLTYFSVRVRLPVAIRLVSSQPNLDGHIERLRQENTDEDL
jgi:hypothetical protein